MKDHSEPILFRRLQFGYGIAKLDFMTRESHFRQSGEVLNRHVDSSVLKEAEDGSGKSTMAEGCFKAIPVWED